MSDIVAKRFFQATLLGTILAIAFAYGLVVERFQVWPYAQLHGVAGSVKSLLEFGEWVPVPSGRRVRAPSDASRERFTLHAPEQVSNGYYVFVGWDSDVSVYAAWLYDNAGKRLHRWPLDYALLDADGPLNGGDHPHAFSVLADGSVVVGFDDGDVMARVDACGRPIWTRAGVFHHAMSQAGDGTMWAWRGENTAYADYQYLENFDIETGAVVREIGLVEDLVAQNGALSAVFAVRPSHPFRRLERDPENRMAADIFHPNDVDVLRADVAPAFPMFETGDLLLSFRNVNLVAVLDPDSKKVKWWSNGPWLGQHDPDFRGDGVISVYSNNTGRMRSEILTMRPATRDVANELLHGNARFYSDFMGVHQTLPNGNVLIAVPSEGRILEVSARGDLVMEFNNLSPPHLNYNEHIENAVWVPLDYFRAMPRCAGQLAEGETK
jgi:hypothetical protein